ncbi:glycosyltransferase family 4 protein (plasmid) [Rahnella variigena]|uniref:glycosyltransferase family 4 protein n=1 Tax=Rahnella variigena TaxID=574964 RepID=UPI003CF35391
MIKFIPNIIVFTRVAKSHYSEKTSSKIIVIPSSIPLLKIAERSKNISNIPSEILSKIIDLKSRGFNIIGANSIITEVKGLDLIIRSLPQLDKCVAVLVGGGDDENKLKELSRSLNVHGRCIFVGFQSDPIPFLSYYDVYAAPSISESFGLSLFEAIACKIPVVCNSLTVFQELLTNDSVFFMDNTIDSFVLSINKALDSNETFLEKAYDLVRDNYDSHVVATKYIKLYEEIKDNARI